MTEVWWRKFWEAVKGEARTFARCFAYEPEFKARTTATTFQREIDYGATVKQLDRALASEKPITYLIGPWGSGKSRFLEYYRSIPEISQRYSFVEKSFFSIQTLREAYFHVISTREKFQACIVFIPAVALYVLVSPIIPQVLRPFMQVVIAIVSYAFITNRLRLFYLSGCFFGAVWEHFKREAIGWAVNSQPVLILEDLDRSSLSSGDQWGLLANMWTSGKKVIVVIGYRDEEARLSLIEIAQKLESPLIDLPVYGATNYAIAVNTSPSFPIADTRFLGEFTPREILEKIDRAQRVVRSSSIAPQDVELAKKAMDLVILRLMANAYLKRCGVDSKHWRFSTSDPQFQALREGVGEEELRRNERRIKVLNDAIRPPLREVLAFREHKYGTLKTDSTEEGQRNLEFLSGLFAGRDDAMKVEEFNRIKEGRP